MLAHGCRDLIVSMTGFSVPWRWLRPLNGFRVVPWDGEPYLVPQAGLAEWNEPPETLCRDFAALYPLKPDSLLAFANAHGWLGIGDELVPKGGTSGSGTRPADPGERLADWQEPIEEVRNALEILDALRLRSDRPLEGWIEWHDHDPEFWARLKKSRAPVRMLRLSGAELEAHGVRDRRGAAHLFALRIVNQGLQAHTGARLRYEPKPPGFELGVKPSNLLGAIWLQVAEYAEGNRRHRQCAACGKWLAIAPDLWRSDRTYCGDVCRGRVLRRRRAEARERHAKGQKISSIAKALKTDPATVTGWIIGGM